MSGTIIGTSGNNVLLGTAADNLILGLGGDDQFLARGGKDTVEGGDGNDLLLGQGGSDTLYGDNQSDTATGGADTVFGGAGNDSLDGGVGIDVAAYESALFGVDPEGPSGLSNSLSLTVSGGGTAARWVATTNTTAGEGTDTLRNIERGGSGILDSRISGFPA